MRLNSIRDDCWIHVFEKSTFGGRGRLLGLGDCVTSRQVGSLIVGPGAIAKVVIRSGREIATLPPRKLVADFSKLGTQKHIARICVAKA